MRLIEPYLSDAPPWCDEVRQLGRDTTSLAVGGADSAKSAIGARIEALITRLPIVLFELDRQGRYTLCTGNGLALLGSSPGRVLGQSIFEIYAHLPEVLAAVRMALHGAETTHTIAVHGRVLATAYVPKIGVSGAIDGVTGVAYDVSELHAKTRELEASERLLRVSESRFRSLITNMRDIIFSHGTQGGAEYGYDENGPAIFGADAQQLAGTVDAQGRPRLDAWYAAVHPDDRSAYMAVERRRKCHHEGYTLEYRIHHPVTGELRWMREVAWVVRDDVLERTHFDSYIIDITTAKQAEIALTESRERYRSLIEAAPVAIMIYAAERCTYANPRAVQLLGGTVAADLEGHHLRDLVDAGESAGLRAELTGLALGGAGMPARELSCLRLDGEPVAVEASAVAVAEHGVPVVQLVLVDLTERKRAEALHHLAQHDALTGLPNRTLLLERLAQARAVAKRGTSGFGLMLLDLDRFKAVNDGFGHAAGDELLRQMARRIRRVIREVDTLARLGGDEFALLQAHTNEPEAMRLVAERIIAAVQEPFRIERQEIRASVSIGIASRPQAADDADGSMRQADLALYRAKAQGRGGFCFFEPSLDAAMAARRLLEADLARAMQQGELHLVYQPQVDLLTGRVVGVEALVRWHHPVQGMVAPSRFIPAAESTGLIRPLGTWVLEQACAQAGAWRHDGLRIPVSVNVSLLQLQRPEFAAQVAEVLQRHRLPSDQLCLELGESVLTDAQADGIGAMLDRLAATGVGFAIDNFGLGHSSLRNLCRLPVRQLKIDRALVGELLGDAGGEPLVRAAIGIGRSLGKNVLGAGVETQAQHHRLRALGCDHGQGFVFARPATAERLRPYLAAHG